MVCRGGEHGGEIAQEKQILLRNIFHEETYSINARWAVQRKRAHLV
jgi:hypothetical protein